MIYVSKFRLFLITILSLTVLYLITTITGNSLLYKNVNKDIKYKDMETLDTSGLYFKEYFIYPESYSVEEVLDARKMLSISPNFKEENIIRLTRDNYMEITGMELNDELNHAYYIKKYDTVDDDVKYVSSVNFTDNKKLLSISKEQVKNVINELELYNSHIDIYSKRLSKGGSILQGLIYLKYRDASLDDSTVSKLSRLSISKLNLYIQLNSSIQEELNQENDLARMNGLLKHSNYSPLNSIIYVNRIENILDKLINKQSESKTGYSKDYLITYINKEINNTFYYLKMDKSYISENDRVALLDYFINYVQTKSINKLEKDDKSLYSYMYFKELNESEVYNLGINIHISSRSNFREYISDTRSLFNYLVTRNK